MTATEFHDLLRRASQAAVEFACRYVENQLPSEFRYHVLLNQSFDGHATTNETVYPEDDGKEFELVDDERVAELLFRGGRCPEWIDVSAEAEGDGYTLVRLLCCGRYTDRREKLYYERGGFGPFGIKSPDLPVGWQESARFRLRRVQQSAGGNAATPRASA